MIAIAAFFGLGFSKKNPIKGIERGFATEQSIKETPFQ